MVESIYFLKPAWCGTHFAGLWPEQGFQPVTRATALRRWFVTCDGILQTYAKLVEEKGASAEKDRLLKVQREHDGDVHSAGLRQNTLPDSCHALKSSQRDIRP